MSTSKHTEGKVRVEKDLTTGELSILSGFMHLCTITTNPGYEANAQRIVTLWNEFDELKENLSRIIERIEENNLQDNFPSAYGRAKTLLNKLSS